MSEKNKTDIIIIGAGPIGLFAVYACGTVGLKCHVVDALDAVGGQCVALYPEKPIYDIPAIPEIKAGELIENLKAQAAPFAPVYHLGQQATACEKTAEGFLVKTSQGTEIEAKAVLIAAGAGAFGPKRPPLEGIEDYENSSVFYLVKERAAFAGKKVVIAGGGDSAVDWALSLSEIAEKVMLVHRRPKFRAAADSIEKLDGLVASGKIELVTPYQLSSLEGENGVLSAVNVATLAGDVKRLEADVLLPFFGLSMDLGPLAHWGLEKEGNFITVDPTTYATNIPGIFAIGDIATYQNKLKLILCGFSEAALASRAAYAHANPETALHFEYSTSKGKPGEKK
ncbi:MAG: NAD(P)/FAD-dependent oxidoreductase [Alphaproteobacteria bacterium]